MNPPVTGGFPSQRLVTQSFGAFFDLRRHKRLSKQCRRRRAHFDVTVAWKGVVLRKKYHNGDNPFQCITQAVASQATGSLDCLLTWIHYSGKQQRRHQISAILSICVGNKPETGVFPLTKGRYVMQKAFPCRDVFHHMRQGIIKLRTAVVDPCFNTVLCACWWWHWNEYYLINLSVHPKTNSWYLRIVEFVSVCSWSNLPLSTKVTSPALGQLLQWRHNERNGVSTHRHIDCLLNRLFRRRSKKTSKLTGYCEGNSPVTNGFPIQKGNNAKNVSIDDVIMHATNLAAGAGLFDGKTSYRLVNRFPGFTLQDNCILT